jgi:YihY family inner membrane protein
MAAVLISGTTAMAQIERGANRAYGIRVDRPWFRRYARAFVVNVTAGLMLIAALVLMAAGPAISDAARSNGVNHTAATVFAWARWPVGIVLTLVAITAIFRVVPNRRQPRWSWLVSGTVVATVLWIAFTALLAAYFALDKDLGETYGPLLGIIGLLLWGYLTSIALLLGFAFAAELESRREQPRVDEAKVLEVPEVEEPRVRAGRTTG